jgi:cupin superfamily acireductone dioxygenase involved in methionine salvage
MEKKMTKKEMFTQIKAVLTDEEQIAFIDHEIELLSKKSSSKKPTATQIANEGLKETIVNVLDKDNGVTASDVLKMSEDFDGMSNQKMSALLKQLVEDSKVIKYTEGKKSLFRLA